MFQGKKMLIIGSIIAVLLQVIIAPNIAIFQVVPNFIIVYTLVAAMLIPGDAVLVVAFVLGLLCDLLGYGPVGALALLLTLAAFAAQRLHAVFDNDTVIAPLFLFGILALLVDILYAAFLVGLSVNVNPLDAFIYRAIPCALYDCVLGIILYPLASRILQGSQPKMNSMPPSLHLR